MARFRCSLYFDIEAQDKDEAQEVAGMFLNFVRGDFRRMDTFDHYIGGVAELKKDDPIGNAERVTDI